MMFEKNITNYIPIEENRDSCGLFHLFIGIGNSKLKMNNACMMRISGTKKIHVDLRKIECVCLSILKLDLSMSRIIKAANRKISFIHCCYL